MLFFTHIKLVISVLVCACAMACIKQKSEFYVKWYSLLLFDLAVFLTLDKPLLQKQF